MPSVPAPSEMLAEMSACAYRLGMGFGRAAERTDEPERQLALFHLFDRCFFAVRVATVLQLRLRRQAGMAAGRDADHGFESETETLEPAEAAEREDRERPDADREREREAERASVPTFLATLRGVAAEAAKLPGPPPTDLPRLQDLLTRANAPAFGAQGPTPAPRSSAPLRDRFAGSAAVALSPPALRPPPALPPRRGTGPPWR